MSWCVFTDIFTSGWQKSWAGVNPIGVTLIFPSTNEIGIIYKCLPLAINTIYKRWVCEVCGNGVKSWKSYFNQPIIRTTTERCTLPARRPFLVSQHLSSHIQRDNEIWELMRFAESITYPRISKTWFRDSASRRQLGWRNFAARYKSKTMSATEYFYR